MTIEILTSRQIAPIRHGFFTRSGGVSKGCFAGLNCGYGSSDDHTAVHENRRRAASAAKVAPETLLSGHQIHSSNVITVHDTKDSCGAVDAMVTDQPDITLSILTADCQPVLFADANAGIIGAAHAGWRGALDGILEKTLQKMIDLGADRQKVVALIGPCISQDAYEVGPEFMEKFTADDKKSWRFFAKGRKDRLHFDLPSYSLDKLQKAGVNHAEWTRHCTYSDPKRFYSYRRSQQNGETDYGRLLSLISL